LTVIGSCVLGIYAIFSCCPFSGSVIKKAKTSLKAELTYSGYSSDQKTKSKATYSDDGMKSNSIMHASYVFPLQIRSRELSPGVKFSVDIPRALLGPRTELA
jgi:hypothetical protein